MGAVTVLKFLRTLALDFPYSCRQLEMQYGKFQKVVLAHVAAQQLPQIFLLESLGVKL